jgi:hypothetical protein
MVHDLLIEALWVFAPSLMLVASILAWRQRRGWSAILQIIGAAAFLVWGLYSIIFMVGGATGALDPHFLWTSKGSWIRHVAIRMLWVAGVCFPIGFLWHTLRGARASNQVMQRTAGRSNV